MQFAVVKRSIVLAGHRTSVSLEDDFWNGLKEIGREHKMTLSSLITDINGRRLDTNLSSAVRLFVLRHFRSKISQTFPDPLKPAWNYRELGKSDDSPNR
jgi:predicted DNA-binding ribbon-helix-helix protein